MVNSGGRRISKELRELIFRKVKENPTWGAPRIHGELEVLGFYVSERTVSRWVRTVTFGLPYSFSSLVMTVGVFSTST
jgi:hypothetical protein